MNMCGKRCLNSEKFNWWYLWPIGLGSSFEEFGESGGETATNIHPKGMSMIVNLKYLKSHEPLFLVCIINLWAVWCKQKLLTLDFYFMGIEVRFIPSFLVGHCCESFGNLVSSPRQTATYK